MRKQNPVISDGKHMLSGVCEFQFPCGYCDNDTADGLIITVDGKNYGVYADPDDGYRSYGCFFPTQYPQSNNFPPQEVTVKNWENYEISDYGEEWSSNGVDFLNSDGDVILSIGTDTSDSYYPMALFTYHPENLPINKKREEDDKRFDDALNTLREILGCKDEEECRIPTEKPIEDDDCLEFEPGCDHDVDKFQAYDQLCSTLGSRSITQTEWEMMEHIVRERIKKDFQKFIDEEFDGYETSKLLFMLENFNLMK